MKHSLIQYEVAIFDLQKALKRLQESKVVIYHLRKIAEFQYTFYASPYTKHRILQIFPSAKIKKEVGLYHTLISLIHHKTTLIALVASIVLFFLFAGKIWKVEVSGDSSQLYPVVYEKLKQNKIQKGMNKIENGKLLLLEEKLLYELNDKIEWLEIRNQGSTLTVKFLKRRMSQEPEKLKGNLYATKDGIIHSFHIKNGEKVVKVNDYVRKGDLLVKDIVTTDQNEDIYIGTLGCVYAYTWYNVDTYITLSDDTAYDETQIFVNLLFKAKELVSKNLSENESIEKESVLLFKKNGKIVSMKVHFTCIEDITKE